MIQTVPVICVGMEAMNAESVNQKAHPKDPSPMCLVCCLTHAAREMMTVIQIQHVVEVVA